MRRGRGLPQIAGDVGQCNHDTQPGSRMLPISAAAIGVLFMGERLTPMQMLAFGIALLGLILATLPARQSAKG